MNNTRIDSMMINMIEPKITEIEERFNRGEGLGQDDINTLLLKSQYNHINHLDSKLNEVANSVVSLEHKFELLKVDFGLLRSEIETTIQKALNRNMMGLIAILGAFMVLSKLIDKLL